MRTRQRLQILSEICVGNAVVVDLALPKPRGQKKKDLSAANTQAQGVQETAKDLAPVLYHSTAVEDKQEEKHGRC